MSVPPVYSQEDLRYTARNIAKKDVRALLADAKEGDMTNLLRILNHNVDLPTETQHQEQESSSTSTTTQKHNSDQPRKTYHQKQGSSSTSTTQDHNAPQTRETHHKKREPSSTSTTQDHNSDLQKISFLTKTKNKMKGNNHSEPSLSKETHDAIESIIDDFLVDSVVELEKEDKKRAFHHEVSKRNDRITQMLSVLKEMENENNKIRNRFSKLQSGVIGRVMTNTAQKQKQDETIEKQQFMTKEWLNEIYEQRQEYKRFLDAKIEQDQNINAAPHEIMDIVSDSILHRLFDDIASEIYKTVDSLMEVFVLGELGFSPTEENDTSYSE